MVPVILRPRPFDRKRKGEEKGGICSVCLEALSCFSPVLFLLLGVENRGGTVFGEFKKKIKLR
jgi:hypothetical protein